MPALRELQAGFRAAMLGGDGASVASAVVADGLEAPARLAVYRHHVSTSLTAALASTYPVIRRLVDPRFFGYAADRYIRDHPPATPCLFEYGGSFPDFLRAFPPCRDLAYLSDVARLEWALNVALHAADVRPLGPDTLRALSPEAVARLVFHLHPSVTLLASPWPIDRIWRANQPEADPEATVKLDAGEVRLEVRRVNDDVVFRPLARDVYTFRARLARGRSLEQAAAAALEADAGFDVTAAVRALLDEQLAVSASPPCSGR